MQNVTKERDFPADRHYDRASHLWAKLDPETRRVVIGIDTLGLEALGDLAYIALPEIGGRVERGKAAGTMEAAKMTGDLVAPVSGQIVARNDLVLRDPSLINRDNYGAGWLVAIEPSNWAVESRDLVHGADLSPWVQAEIVRYREQGWINA